MSMPTPTRMSSTCIARKLATAPEWPGYMYVIVRWRYRVRLRLAVCQYGTHLKSLMGRMAARWDEARMTEGKVYVPECAPRLHSFRIPPFLFLLRILTCFKNLTVLNNWLRVFSRLLIGLSLRRPALPQLLPNNQH